MSPKEIVLRTNIGNLDSEICVLEHKMYREGLFLTDSESARLDYLNAHRANIAYKIFMITTKPEPFWKKLYHYFRK